MNTPVKVARVLNPSQGKMWGVYCADGSYCELPRLQLINARTVIDRNRQQADKRFGTKSLHAWIEGYVVQSDYPFPMPGDGWMQLSYYPYTDAKGDHWQANFFVDNEFVEDRQYNYAVFNDQGRVWVYE